ncbi:MAG: hypothetical protein LBC33_02700 [Mycoplasmataceae bacterium]|jgi:hypothetical protein|nr:hypothetical protein [Mycoplasmataceae bacterium]
MGLVKQKKIWLINWTKVSFGAIIICLLTSLVLQILGLSPFAISQKAWYWLTTGIIIFAADCVALALLIKNKQYSLVIWLIAVIIIDLVWVGYDAARIINRKISIPYDVLNYCSWFNVGSLSALTIINSYRLFH